MAVPVKLHTIETFIIDLPTIRPHVLSMATIHHQTVVLVRLVGTDGCVGWGEGTTIGGLSYGEECPQSIKVAIDTYIRPVLETCDLARVGACMAMVARHVVGNHFAKCAVETALLDAAGRRLGVPLSTLVGGGLRRERLPVAWTLASGDTAADIDEAGRMLAARRHNIFKLKIGKRALADDVAHVRAIKRALGDQASVRVDVNQAWDEVTAARGLPQLQDAGVDLVEQPVPRHAVQAMARLAAGHAIALMADEALRGPRDGFALAAAAAADVFALKIAQAGGVLEAAKLGAIADAAGIGLYGGTMLEAGIGTAASAHLCATLPSLAWGTELFGPLLLVEEILVKPLDYSDFTLGVPTGPGLGVEPDVDRVAHFRRDRSTSLHTVITVDRAGKGD